MDIPESIGVGIALTTDPQMTRGLLEQFCLALGDATGVDVRPRGVSSYARLMEQLTARTMDLVWLPPVPALQATARGVVVPVVLPVRDGHSFYHAALFTRRETGLAEPRDLAGVTAAWVDPESAAGYLIVRAHLAHQGVDLRRAFGRDLFLGSHDAVAEAVMSGRADVGATFAYFDERGRVKRAGWGTAPAQVVTRAGPIPNDIIAARADCSSLVVRLVQSALVDVQNAQLREAARALLAAQAFEVPSAEHLAPLRALLPSLSDRLGEASAATAHSMFPPPRGDA